MINEYDTTSKKGSTSMYLRLLFGLALCVSIVCFSLPDLGKAAPPDNRTRTFEYVRVSINEMAELGELGWRLLPMTMRGREGTGNVFNYAERETTPGTKKVKYEYTSASMDALKRFGVDAQGKGFKPGDNNLVAVNTGSWRVRMAIHLAPARDDIFILERQLE